MERIMEMDAIQKRLIHLIVLVLFLSTGGVVLQAQTIKAYRVLMDTTAYQGKASAPIREIINTYSPELNSKMNQVVGYTTTEMRSYYPESPLSNLAGDALLAIARRHYGPDNVDFSLTNFGGIRTSFPKGDLTLYYVYAAFPFENALVLISMKGSRVRELFETLAAHRVEIVAGVSLKIDDHRITQLLVNGEPVDEERVYHIATIDFLLQGGDRMTLLKNNMGVDYSGLTLRDVILQYINVFTKNGEPIPARTDKRVVINNPKE
jgi:2',3'-cyclic-nucleotide 2'-phosphodiesterase (5'-nucleotidase family)